MLYSLFHTNDSKDTMMNKWVHYFPIYESYLKNYINKSVVLIEIGVAKGGSLKMWKHYLGPFAVIVGIDIDQECMQYEDEQCKVRIGSQNDYEFLNKIIREFGTPDIVIDDGSHIMDDMNKTFNFLYPILNNNGVYIVEDTHTCYWKDWGGGLKKEGSFIERAKDMIDRLNAYHIQGKNMVNSFTRSTFSINFFDSVIVFEKMEHGKPYTLQKGNVNL